MKIVNKSENIEVALNDIKVGDAFYYPHSGGLYMKTESMFDSHGYTMSNAVNLRLGSLCAFPPDYKVIAVECECVVYDK